VLTKYLRMLVPKPVHDGSSSRVKGEKGKARVSTETVPSDAELKQVIIPPLKLTSLIKAIIDRYSEPSAPSDQAAAPGASAANPLLTVTVPMSISDEKTLWTRAFQGLNESARKTATNLYVEIPCAPDPFNVA
jgi:hypothetical protein